MNVKKKRTTCKVVRRKLVLNTIISTLFSLGAAFDIVVCTRQQVCFGCRGRFY